MSASITSSITDGQRTQYARMVKDAAKHGVKLALDKVEADSVGWQRVLENGDELKTAIAEIIVAKSHELSISNRFANEEVQSSYGYLSGYTPKGITEQCMILRKLFPGIPLRVDEDVKDLPLPPNAEGWFAVPRWEKIAPTYGEAVEIVFNLIRRTRDGKFYNYREGQLGSQQLRQHSKTASGFQKLGDEQKDHDILVIPAQFGIRHRGCSVRRAREVFLENEFGLGAFAVGIMLLTYPERLQYYDDLWIDCAGDEFSSVADGIFDLAPCFKFSGGRVRFVAGWVDDASEVCGSASGFVPQ